MLKVENIESWGWEAAIRGMRNPKKSYAKSDSYWVTVKETHSPNDFVYCLGSNDLDLATRLCKGGPEHAKFLRMIHVQMDITAPLFLWTELDTYKVSTTRNSTSKMHKIHTISFTPKDFSHEGIDTITYAKESFNQILITCEKLRQDFNKTKDKKYWRALIELLPEAYNMLATWNASMQTILSILKQRKGHKLDEWEQFRQACFDNIPYCQEFYDACYPKEAKNQVETN